MIVKTELQKDDYDHLYDVMYEVYDKEPTNEEIDKCWNTLPNNIIGTAIKWGTSDSVFRDEMYEYLMKNK